MKKVKGLILAISSFLTFAPSAFALSLCPGSGTFGANLCTLNINSAIGKFIAFIYVVAIVAALFYLIWGGLKWLTSGGDKAAVQIAREHIIAAIVGLVIIFLSYVILGFIGRFFLGSGFDLNNINVPTI